MFHLILGILKIIGIILLILISLFLLILLAIAFVPVRYYARGKFTGDETYANVKVSWLLHIISFTFSIDRTAKSKIAVRLFGIKLPLFGSEPKHGKKKRPEKESGKRKEDVISSQEKERIPEETDPILEDDMTEDMDPVAKEDMAEAMDPAAKDNISYEVVRPEEERLQEEKGDESSHRKSSSDKGNSETDETEEEQIGFSFERIYDKIKNILGAFIGTIRKVICMIKAFLQKIHRFFTAVCQVPGKLEKAGEKIGGILKKPQEFSELAKKLEAGDALKDVIGYLKYILKHCSPRRVKGYLHFGTGDPAVTAQLTGLLYLVLPAKADKFLLTPDFNEAIIEADFTMKGHVRVCHFLRILWLGFRNKKLRRIIRYGKKKHR
ncbi:MAG: DUF2953 domain-containing protein [Lachnospiraceae bacterium]|nr:DUF2953 domain-containing protein [Lachnospiraceae bacterium]